jgi:hypothetical protein
MRLEIPVRVDPGEIWNWLGESVDGGDAGVEASRPSG